MTQKGAAASPYRQKGATGKDASLKLVVRQTVSEIGRPHPQRAVLKGLGLSGVGSHVTVENTPSFRGMIKKVLHLVTVEERAS
jgi:large subunit ribosomal protein L30